MRPATQVYVEDVSPGDEIPELVKHCTPRQLVMWAAASGDFYEIHYDAQYARSIGLPGLVVHGALKNAFLGALLHAWVAPQWTHRAVRLLIPGPRLPRHRPPVPRTVTATEDRDGEHLVHLDIWIENPEGDGHDTRDGDRRAAVTAR